MRPAKENDDLDTAKAWLAAIGLQAERFTKADKRKGHDTPDFRLFRDGQHVGFCEVKSPREEQLDKRLRAAAAAEQSFRLVGKDDTHVRVYNRISDHIDKAVEQFDAVNPDRTLPNILVFVNWNETSDFSDLHEALFGEHHYVGDNNRLITDYSRRKIAEGQTIGTRKHRIDLYVWIDGRTKQPEGYLFSGDFVFRDKICGWLGVDPANIEKGEQRRD
jgi:hypothetical protein